MTLARYTPPSAAASARRLAGGSPSLGSFLRRNPNQVGAAHERARVGRGQAPDVPVLRRRG